MGSFRDITTFGLHHGASDVDFIATVSVAAILKLNIIRRALNLGYDMHFAKNPRNSFLYYPYNPLVPEGYNYYKEQINSGIFQIIGNVKIEGVKYNVLGGGITYDINSGLGDFNYQTGCVSFLGCATKEIAEHFGMLITEARYGDLESFEISESKYNIG